MSMESVINLDPKKHSSFISYSWDDDRHMTWVEHFARILEKAGIQTVLDRKDFQLGDPLPRMMEEAITKCEYVLFVCTPNYKKKSDEHHGGVAYEDSIITSELLENQNQRKFIPIFPYGKIKESTPIWARGKLGVDMSSDMKYYDGIRMLVNRIAPDIPFPPEKEKSERLSSFYSLPPYFQIKILSSLHDWTHGIPDIEEIPSAVETILYALEDMETERFKPEVMQAWKEAHTLFEDDNNDILEEFFQLNPDY